MSIRKNPASELGTFDPHVLSFSTLFLLAGLLIVVCFALVFSSRPLFAGHAGTAATLPSGGPPVWHLVNEQPRPSPRFGFGAAFDTVRRTLVLHAGAQYIDTGNETWIRSGGNWALLPTNPTPPAQYGVAMAYDAVRGEMVLFGGLDFSTGSAQPSAETWTWDGAAWHKRDIPVSPSARAWAALAYDSVRQEVVLFGGLYVDNIHGVSRSLGDTWVWDGTQWTHRDTPVAPSPRYDCGMDYDPIRKQMVLFGGNLEQAGGQWSAETWVWNGTAWTQLSPANSPDARQVGAFGIDPRTGTGILFGGGAMFAFLDTWIWDGNNWTMAQPQHQPVSRDFSHMIYDADAAEMLLVYGWNANALLRDIWAWTGNDWVERTKPLEPSPRAYGNMCLDEQHGVALLFGGLGCDSILGETWSWDGNRWRQLFPQTSPSPRYGYAIAYDAARGNVVLFGGQNANVLGDTWIWDGANWSQPSGLVLTPPARHHAAMAYDPLHKEVVLFGGDDPNDVLLGDTWVWNGTQWNLRPPVGVPPSVPPTPRFRSAMAWDQTSQEIILFGGFDDLNGTLGDTWAWNGTEWTQLTPANSPEPRYGHGMATDPASGHAVLFRSPDTWTWDGSNWQQVDTSVQSPSPRRASYFAGDPTGTGVVLFGGPSIDYRDDTWRLVPNNAPVANDQSLAATENTPVPIVLAATDADGDFLSYAIVSGPAHGSLTGAPPNVTYTPVSGYTGPDTFTFKANDGFVDSNTAVVNITVTPPVPLTAVVSRKLHGSVSTFDIDLSNGNGIECRSGGATGDYSLVFTFANPLINVVSANVTTGTGTIVSEAIDSSDAHNYVVNLTGVANAQLLTVTLADVSDGAGNFSSAVSAQMGVLLGDVNASGRVDAADVSSVRQQTLQPITAENFREDINATGRIDAVDVSIARQQTLTSLP